MPKTRGIFITLEGADGCGKTTQAARLAEQLRQNGYVVVQTREPGGTPIGDQIREVVHSLKNTDMHPHTEVLLYIASRAQHVAQLIKPALDTGKIVVCDRFADSTLAYQGFGHGLDRDALRTLINFATDGLKPDLTLLFDITAEIGLQRRQQDAQSGGDWNRMDAYALDFHRKVAQGYQQLVATEPDRWQVINADQGIDAVHAKVWEMVQAELAKHAHLKETDE